MQHIPGMSFHKAMKERDRILTTIDQLIEEFFIKNLGQKLRLLGVDLRQGDGNRMLTRDEIKNNVLFLMFAGHDTTYTSILTLIYHLSQGPDAMEEIVEEVTK
jgi:cytochrome P450